MNGRCCPEALVSELAIDCSCEFSAARVGLTIPATNAVRQISQQKKVR